jgi:sugar/nucleoside kinase (ribokinase family)
MCVTRGAEGAVVYEAQHKSVVVHTFAGANGGKAPDTVGSGDIFGAAFLYRYCTAKNFADAGGFANRAAAASVHASGEGKFSAIAAVKETP